jgi:hypothetical protein
MAVAVFITTNVLGQAEPWATMNDATTIGENDSVVSGASMMYFVMPDPVLSGGFVTTYDSSATNAAQNILTTFDWTLTSNVTGNATLTQSEPQTADVKPYVVVTFGGTGGTGTIAVAETQGACADLTPTTITCVVIDAPSFTVGSGYTGTAVDLCDGDQQTISITTIADDNIAGVSSYKIMFDVNVETQESDGTHSRWVRRETDTVLNVNLNASGAGGYDLYNITFTAEGLAGNDSITVYSWDFGTGGGLSLPGNANGINNHISRKSDFFSLDPQNVNDGVTTDKVIADETSEHTWYAATDGGINGVLYVYKVYLVPNTGEIYFIPNNWDL